MNLFNEIFVFSTHPNDQSRAGNGAVPRGTPQVPIIKTPPVFPLAHPPSLGPRLQELAQPGQYVDAPHYGRGFKQRGYGRFRGGGYGGRNKYKSFPRGHRGGGNINPGAPGIADTSSRGNGGNSRGGNGGGPAFQVARCWKCSYPNPSQNTVCSQCWSRMC